MKKIGQYQNREVYWTNYLGLLNKELPASDWVLLLTSSKSKPDIKLFDQITRRSIKNGIVEFKGHGKFGENLHDWFDETMVAMETTENYSEIEVITTWHNKEAYADVFWQCFFATCLSEPTDYETIQIVCSDLDGINRTEEIKECLARFKNGWLPEAN